jgi:tetratricopeptide (TPR) repeat protein
MARKLNRIGDYDQAIVMIDYAIALDSMAHDDIACSIDYNNKTVILMNMQKFEDALSFSARAVKLMEKIIFQIRSAKPITSLVKDKKFISKLNLLLAIYCNLVHIFKNVILK